MDAIARGSEALMYFHNQASKYDGYHLSFDELKATLGTPKQIPIYLQGFGEYIGENEMSASAVKSAMEGLADQGEGRVPSQTSIFNALGGKVSEINWLDLSTTVAVETVKQVASGAQAVGDSVITTFSTLNTLLPIVAVGAILFIVFKRTKQIAG